MHSTKLFVALAILSSAFFSIPASSVPAPQQSGPSPAKSKVILDTDIGDDVDDAFALALVLRSPEIELLGVTTAWGDTELRARLAERFLKETAAPPIPVLAVIKTKSAAQFSQERWARDSSRFENKGDA